MNVNFSLIIPTFNSHEDLKRLLESLAQIKHELDKVEIIVVDDGSCDDTAKVVRDFVGRLKPLEYFYQKNRGPAAARNLGALKAKGKYLIFIDDDCLMPKGCVDGVRDFYEKNKVYAGVGVKTVNISKSVFSEYNQRLGDFLIEFSHVSGNTYEYVSSRCYSFVREAYWAINGHDEEFIWPAAEDRDFCLRLKEANMQLAYLQTTAVVNTDHLRLKGFIKQNFVYGLGAGLLTQKHPNGSSFSFIRFKKMFLKIVQDRNIALQLKLSVAFLLAQISSTAGILYYKINYDYKNRPPAVFPPRVFVFVEVLKNFILGIPFIGWIKNLCGSLSTGEELFTAGSLALSAQKVQGIYNEVLVKEFGNEHWFKGRKILEIGPGSHLGVSMLFLAQGAKQVVAVDKYGEVKFRKKESEIYDQILSQLSNEDRDRAAHLSGELTLNKIRGFDEQRALNYLPDTSIDSPGFIQRLPVGYFDLIVSFNTLEHIKDLNIAIRNMKGLLNQGGIAIHRVDAGSHYAVIRHTKNLLSQFLYSDTTWQMMFSYRSAPTRRILNDYIEIAQSEGVSIKEFCVDELANESAVNIGHKFLLKKFRCYSPQQISKTGFIATFTKN